MEFTVLKSMNVLSRAGKNLTSYPTCKLMSQLTSVSWMLRKRYNTPGSETKDFVTTIAAARGPAFSCRSSLSPNSHKTTQRGPSDSYTHSELHEGEKGKKRDESLENLTLILHGKVCLLLVLKTDAAPLYQGRKNTCTLLWRENYILQGCWLGRHP